MDSFCKDWKSKWDDQMKEGDRLHELIMEKLREMAKKLGITLKDASTEEGFGFDSVGRVSTSTIVFDGENPHGWLWEAEQCLTMKPWLSEKEKIEATVACYVGEAWEWFLQMEEHCPISTWDELKILTLKQFGQLMELEFIHNDEEKLGKNGEVSLNSSYCGVVLDDRDIYPSNRVLKPSWSFLKSAHNKKMRKEPGDYDKNVLSDLTIGSCYDAIQILLEADGNLNVGIGANESVLTSMNQLKEIKNSIEIDRAEKVEAALENDYHPPILEAMTSSLEFIEETLGGGFEFMPDNIILGNEEDTNKDENKELHTLILQPSTREEKEATSFAFATKGESPFDVLVLEKKGLTEDETKSHETMMILGLIKCRKVSILIDSGSSSSFIDEKLVESLKFKCEAVTRVSIDKELEGKAVGYPVIWQMHGLEFQHWMKSLKLMGANIVLGADWISHFGPVISIISYESISSESKAEVAILISENNGSKIGAANGERSNKALNIQDYGEVHSLRQIGPVDNFAVLRVCSTDYGVSKDTILMVEGLLSKHGLSIGRKCDIGTRGWECHGMGYYRAQHKLVIGLSLKCLAHY